MVRRTQLLAAICGAANTRGIESVLSPEASVTKSLSGVPFRRGSKDNANDLRRMEYLTVTVPDLDVAADFYTQVLGAHEIDFCAGKMDGCRGKAVRIEGAEHQLAMMGLDVEDGVQLPNIADGAHEALARFFLFGNGLVQLLKFAESTTGESIGLAEPRTSPAWVGQAHIDWWIEEGIDPNEYIKDVEERSHSLGMKEVRFNRPVPQQTREDREKVPEDAYANQAVGGAFDGLAWAYFKGPFGEQYEIYQIDRTLKRSVGRAYCDRGAVSHSFVDKPKASDEKLLSQKLHGIFQYGYRTADLHRAVAFYTEVLGGDLIAYPTHGQEIMLDDTAHWMIFANETIEAYEYARATGTSVDEAFLHLGVPNISSSGSDRLDHRFILFDNFVVEPLRYTDGLSFGADGFNPALGRKSSLAYHGTVTAAFGVSESTHLRDYISAFSERLDRQGLRGAKAPVGVASFSQDHPFHGLEYGYAKGVDGEAIALVKVGGPFKEVLHQALSAIGAVSTMFDDTNPHALGEMEGFCAYAQFEAHEGAFIV